MKLSNIAIIVAAALAAVACSSANKPADEEEIRLTTKSVETLADDCENFTAQVLNLDSLEGADILRATNLVFHSAMQITADIAAEKTDSAQIAALVDRAHTIYVHLEPKIKDFDDIEATNYRGQLDTLLARPSGAEVFKAITSGNTTNLLAK